MKKIFKIILITISTSFIILSISLTAYSFYAIKDLSSPEINAILDKKYSIIYDDSSREIEILGENKKNYIEYEKIPQILIDALISIEDKDFFNHNGINYQRIFSSLINNIFSSSTQGGSTITQQLVKNLLLSNERTLKRKIQEAYLATLIEKKISKEKILEYYFNEVYFDGTVPGISYASKRFFNKDVSHLNLNESAILAGLVKSPTYYSPFLHIENTNKRKNIVLKAMLDNKKISKERYDLAIKSHASEFIIEKGSTYQEKTYDYQAYLDIVYQEVEILTGLNPFTVPLEIHTFLDTSIQSYLDKIQKGEIFSFSDNNQQIASSIIRNEDSSIIGVIGGRNYDGLMLYNRAFNMKRQPASTMKPIFTYALAMEYLNFHEYSLVEDKPYTYPGTQITVQNADKNFLGTLPLVDAMGYSRNTSTLYTLEKVINKIGQENVVKYLEDINMMDEGSFTYPYAIGGMKYGVSPINLAGAYAMLARGGNYLKPSTIKEIKLIDTGEVIYRRNNDGNQVLKNESAYLISSVLKKVIDGNYYNIAYAKPYGIQIHGKTGTNAYDDNRIKLFNYPSYADCDVWFAGYSKNFTIASWSGFDEPKKGQNNYFGKNDSRRYIVKDIFKESLSKLELKNNIITKPSSLTEVNIVKGINKNYLPNEYVPTAYIVTASFKNDDIPTEVLPLPTLKEIENIEILSTEESLFINIQHQLNDDELYLPFFGKKSYILTFSGEDFSETHVFQTNTLELNNYKKSFTLTIAETFENNTKLTSNPYIFNYDFSSLYNI